MTDAKPPAAPYRAPPPVIDVERVDVAINRSLRKQITEAIKKTPELVLAIVRSWKDQNR